MYTFNSRIRYSEVGEDGHITVPSIIDYMQDCTNFQSEDLGVGLAFHREHNLMWVLNSWQIVIEKYPKMGEEIVVGTQSYGYEKMLGYRNFLITDKKGNCVAKANSNWVLMDTKKKRPTIVKPEIGDVYGKAEPLEMDYAPRKIKVPEGGTEGEAFVVREYHLDTNHHVNNRQYVQMAMEFISHDAVIKELRVEYKKQAILGDMITPVIYNISDKEKMICLNGQDQKPYAVVQFFME